MKKRGNTPASEGGGEAEVKTELLCRDSNPMERRYLLSHCLTYFISTLRCVYGSLTSICRQLEEKCAVKSSVLYEYVSERQMVFAECW